MDRKLRGRAVATAACVAVAWTAAASAGETERGVFHLGTSAHAPGALTGLKLRVLYRDPDDPAGKPPAITSAVFRLPKGMRIDTGAVPRCSAGDAEIRAQGREACPAESRVGGGRLVARTGVPGSDRVTADVVVFNGQRELIEVVFLQGTNIVAGLDRLTVAGNVLTAHPPATPGGPPDGRTAVRRIFLELPARTGAGGRPYARTPRRCRGGRWRATARYEFADGGETTVRSRTRCGRRRDG